MKTAIVILAVLAIPGIAISATIYVPDDYPTIQGAIDAAVNGDTIIVRPGTYVENIDFVGKAITVESEHGVDVTLIDGNQAGSVVTCQSGEGLDSVLDGFTITNGFTEYDGGGMLNKSSSPTVTNCIFSANMSWCSKGGGMYNLDNKPTVTHCIFSGNTTSCSDGGGMYNDQSSPTVNNCTFIDNSADADVGESQQGGGMYNSDSTVTVTGCTFSGNVAVKYYYLGGGGGGMYNSNSTVTVTGCTFSENEVIYNSANGGGMYNSGSTLTVETCIFSKNVAPGFGGGMYNSGGIATVANCIFSGNEAGWGGGGICGGGSIFSVTNCTFTNNSADPEHYGGGGIYSDGNITNCILWNNIPDQVMGDATVTYCCVQGGYPGTGNIDSDPLFVDPANNDFHITFLSPCRGSGDNTVVTELYDFEGDPRIYQGTVDMGADEFYTHMYITGDQTPGGSIQGKLVGLPGTSPVYIIIGFDVFDPPKSTIYGDLYIKSPRILTPLFPMPGDGIIAIPTTVPPTPPAPYDVPMQALIGLNSDSLSNLCVLEVR